MPVWPPRVRSSDYRQIYLFPSRRGPREPENWKRPVTVSPTSMWCYQMLMWLNSNRLSIFFIIWWIYFVVVVVLHSPRYPGGSSCGAHADWSSLWVSILSTIRIIRFAMVFNTCTSSFWKMFLNLIFSFTQGVSLHSSIMCFWVSGKFLQYLHMVFFWNLFFWFIFTGSIDVLVFMMALHSFLLSFSRYSGLLLMDRFSMFSHQCFVFVLFSASSWVLFLVISIIFLFMIFFISFFEHFAICSFTLNSFRIPLVLSIQVLFSCCVIFWISGVADTNQSQINYGHMPWQPRNSTRASCGAVKTRPGGSTVHSQHALHIYFKQYSINLNTQAWALETKQIT